MSSSYSSRSSRSTVEPKQLARHHFWITIISAVSSLALLAISSLVLHDTVRQINGRTELQYALFPQYGVDFYDQVFHDEMLIVLIPVVIFTSLVQFFVSIALYRRKAKLYMLLLNLILLIPLTTAFVISIIYKVDTVGLRTPDFNGHNINTYFAYKYDKGQAFCGILGCDMFIVLFAALSHFIPRHGGQ